MDVETRAFGGEQIRDLVVFGQVVDAWVRPRREEVTRRRSQRVGAITAGDAIRTLMTLPHGVSVDLDALHPLDRLVVDALPTGIVRVDHRGVTRLATPPVEISALVKWAASWDDVQAISLLRTHAPRLVVAHQDLARRILRDADTDIGVRVENEHVMLREPGRRWLKPSWQRWLVTELAYSAWRERP